MINGENLEIKHTNCDDYGDDENVANPDKFKGIYYEDNIEQQYYEYGAHFSYKNLCSKLESLISILSPDRKGKSIYEDEYSTSTHVGSYVKTKQSSDIVVPNKVII